MNKALSFARLDCITVKPYFTLKNLFIFSGVSLIMIITSDTSTSCIAVMMVYATLYVSFPFAVGEENGLDALYATLSISRSTVVLGRYLFAIILDLCAGFCAYAFSFAAMSIMKKDFNSQESLAAALVILLLYSIIQAAQLPIYFKLGYAKAKFLVYLPFIGLALITLLITSFLKDSLALLETNPFFQWFAANPFITAFSVAAIWLAIMAVSYRTSVAFYRERDF